MKIHHYLSDKTDSIGNSEVLLRVVISRAHVYRIKSGIRVPKLFWNVRNEKITIPRIHTEQRKNLVQLQSLIDNLNRRIAEHLEPLPPDNIDKAMLVGIVTAFNLENAPIDKETIREDSFQNGFESFIKLQVKTHKRAELYRCLWKQMERFAIYRKGCFSWKFEITADDIFDFEHFLLNEYNFFDDEGKPLEQYEYIYRKSTIPRQVRRGKNAVAGIIKRLRIFFNWAQKTQLFTSQNPFINYHSHQCVYGIPYFMTKNEIDLLLLTDFSSNRQLEFHRDLFVFQSNVGMRVGDLFMLTKQNIVNGDTLEYIPSKTSFHSGKHVSVPLTKIAKSIIEKYKEESRTELFPFDSTHLYNINIKKVLKTAGINRMVTIFDPLTSTNRQRPICEIASSHMARRNFIGNLYNSVADPNIIGSMTGHVEGSKAFSRYRTIGEDLKKKALAALE